MIRTFLNIVISAIAVYALFALILLEINITKWGDCLALASFIFMWGSLGLNAWTMNRQKLKQTEILEPTPVPNIDPVKPVKRCKSAVVIITAVNNSTDSRTVFVSNHINGLEFSIKSDPNGLFVLHINQLTGSIEPGAHHYHAIARLTNHSVIDVSWKWYLVEDKTITEVSKEEYDIVLKANTDQ